MKKIFIVGASLLQLPAIQKAKAMGFHVGVADYDPRAVGIVYADEFFEVSTIDEEGIYQAAKRFNADAIMTLATDMPMRSVAYAANKLGLAGISYDTAIRATDKGEMIRAFEKHGVAHPLYKVAAMGSDIKKLIDDIHFPVITKPTDNSGSRGIMLALTPDQLQKSINYSSVNGRSGDVIVEEYMQGTEVSVEAMVINNIPHILQITDKLTTGAPHFVEIGHSEPSRLQKNIQEQIKTLVKQAIFAIGQENGAVHAEVIVTQDGPKMVEIGARMGGDCISTMLVPLSTGIDMTKAAIESALGNQPDINKKFDRASAIRFLLPKAGRVVSISGKEKANAVPGIQLVDIQCREGQRLEKLENGTNRIGYVISHADVPETAIEICERALEKIKIEIS